METQTPNRRSHKKWLSIAVLACAGTLAVAAWTWIPGSRGTAGQDGPAVRRPTSAEVETLHRAEQLLVRDCMKRQGFRYWPTPLRPSPDFRDFPYVVDDVAWAKAHGYGRDIEKRLDKETESSPRALYYRSLSESRKQA